MPDLTDEEMQWWGLSVPEHIWVGPLRDVPKSEIDKQRELNILKALSRKPRKPRKPTLVSVAKQASKAGIEVARYEVEPDGKINIVTGKREPSTESNPWLDDLKVTKQ
jgi:hypothetical protein